ncbi:30S ribosomal protein S6e [Candidatus Woesearchaeota archaeon]|nr:30S ribosomal protein S6e [Candidatus Woesearchaeota archaeon]
MAEFKIVVSNPKNGLSAQLSAKDQSARSLIGLKIGDKVSGELLGLAGFEFEITGGSDYCGFPMRKDLPGVGRKRLLAVFGVGFGRAERGVRQRKTVCGNTVHERIVQVNLKVVKEGKDNIFADAEKKVSEKKAEKEAKKAEKAGKKEKAASEKSEEKASEKKEEVAAEKKPEAAAPAKAAEKKAEAAAEKKPVKKADKEAAAPESAQ